MQKIYSAIDLRGYPCDLYETVVQVVPVDEISYVHGLVGVEVEQLSQIKQVPKSVTIIIARGGKTSINRTFLTSKKIDVLSHPYPFDSYQARLAAKNNIAVELCFKELPLVITSGATSAFDIKPPRTLVAFGKVLGLDYQEAKACIWHIPKKILEGVTW
jgi:RNase P/RNase MRP subunit p30